MPADGKIIVIGDKKGPLSYSLPKAVFYGLREQLELSISLSKALPTGHYARKNIGYLLAIKEKADSIYETDDDNAPMTNWRVRDETVPVQRIRHDGSPEAPIWVNIYKYFSEENIWPRGLPLDNIKSFISPSSALESLQAPIQQGLVNNSPDVDAIWRLTMDHPFSFEERESIYLDPGVWSPFNTQSTWWWPDAYPLLYIPSYCSFRMCDIWKSFIAQRCLWELGHGIAIHASEAIQERNYHNLMRDFADEVPGYINNQMICETLLKTKLIPGRQNALDNLARCYEALIDKGIFPKEEMGLVQCWIKDFSK